MLRELYRIKNKNENKKLVDLVKSGLNDLKDEIKEMSENEIEIERPDKIVILLKRLLSLIDRIKEDKD